MRIFLSVTLWVITGLLWIYWLMLPAEAKEEVKEVKQKEVSIVHNWRPKDSIVQEYVQYAYKISWNDIDFVATLEAENWTRDPKKQSNIHQYYDKEKWKNVMCNKANWNSWCKREESYWFCQMMKKFHPQVKDERFFTDPKRQLETCYAKYKWWTKFYWYNVRHKVINRFTFTQSNAGIVTQKQAVLNYYAKAVEATKTRQTLSEQLDKAKTTEVKARGDCKTSKQCTDN